MTVIAWDGKTLAADRLAVMDDETRFLTCKIERLADGRVLARMGDRAHGLAMMRWFREGADPEKYPEAPADISAAIVIASVDGVVYYQHASSEPQSVLEPFMAFGAGHHLALGALEQGADARRAVEVACKWSIRCGLGCDAFDIVSETPLILRRGSS